jgi:hypothetical protein
LFQFSYALNLAEQDSRVSLDLSHVRRGVPAIFEVPLIGDRARQMALPVTRFIPSPSGRLPLLGKLSRMAMRPGRMVLDKSAQGADPSSSVRPAWWFGYWQRLSYAKAVIPLLRGGLAPHGANGDHPPGRPAIARIHVRQGDYAGNPCELPAEWYRRALEMVYALGGNRIVTQVVTNGPEWCRQNLNLDRPYEILPTGTALEDMRVLAASDFLVISRSTFSWWAAAISDAIVVAPDPWSPTMKRNHNQVIFPSTWRPCPV